VSSTIALEGDGTAVEYAGGYSDYLLQRPPRETAMAAPGPRKDKAPAPPPREPRQRLGYKRERALAELPKKMEKLQAEITTLQFALADADLYRRDPKTFNARTARLGAVQAELEAAETEWLELEMLREELDG
jgi:ATP-binding cassette subfamily F protein uup